MTQSNQQGQNNPSQKPGQAEQSAPNKQQPGQSSDKKQQDTSKQQK
ncbi:MAG: transcription initiation factor TFIID subunit D10 [Comamonas sp.]